ncbi:MAG: TonB-dependent receptor [Prolixibacteraceae bacterium]|nr:TonB-dependent receptor [Prolixibacteraceae bacterium]
MKKKREWIALYGGDQKLMFSLKMTALSLFFMIFTILTYGIGIPDGEGSVKNISSVETIMSSSFQQRSVNGVVTDQGGLSLPGVSIVVKGTTVGTVTNVDGKFTLTIPANAEILQFSFVGMTTQEIAVAGKTEFRVVMEEETIGLEEVVAVGYGVQKKTNLTGSVSEINAEEIEMRASNSATQALQGLASNLNISVNASGGAADASMSMNIRGIGSLSSSSPYILINGIRASESELAALNPNDIQNISVLKDAASAAIYGAQAAYGVILVETKKGSYNKDLEVTYSNNFRLKKRIYVPPMLGSETYAEVLNIASKNYSGQVAIGEEQMAKIRAFSRGEIENQTEPNPANPNQWLGIESGTSNGWFSGYANSNFWDIIYKDQEFAQKHDISASGGSDRIFYNISGSYFDDSGALNYGDENEYFKRYTFESNVTSNITDWLIISNNTRFYQENNSFPATLEGDSRGRLYHDAMRFPPLAPYKTPAITDDEGNEIVPEQLALIPAWLENNGFSAYNENNLISTFKAEWQIVENLKLKGDFSFKKIFYDRTMNFKRWSLLGPDGKPNITYQMNNNQIEKDIRKTDYTSYNIYANYVKSFGEHNFDIVAGYQQEEQNYFRLNTARQDVLANNLNSLNIAIGEITTYNNPISTWGTLGVFGRLSYNYKEKYLFEFNGRYDGSSKFEEGDRFGFFPSVSVGYNIHKENFWASSGMSDIINTFKLRVSLGQLGNQNVGSYLYLANIPINTRLAWIDNGQRPNYSDMPGIVSPDITWETSVTRNIGADLTFLNNRLSAIFDIYSRDTDNMFGPSAALPSVLGASPPRTNSASLNTKGWELTLGWRDRYRDFRYSVNFMLADNKSVITKYHNPDKVLSSWYEGEVIGEIWGFEVDELFQTQSEVEEYLSEINLSYFGTGWQPGDVKYKDLNGDKKVNLGENTKNNPGDRRIIGNDQPRYNYSLSGNASWKNFDFHMLWQGIGKRDYFPSNYATLFWGWNSRGHTNISEAVLDFWSEDNPDGYLPLPLEAGGANGFAKDRYTSTRYLQNSSYIRLKSLSFGYTLPASLTNRINFVDRVKFYFNGENLLTISKLWENFDPELAQVTGSGRIGDSRAYPLARVLGFGVNVTF